MQITPTKYKLLSLASGKQFDDTGWLLEAPGETALGLIRAIYHKNQIDVKPLDYGKILFFMKGQYASKSKELLTLCKRPLRESFLLYSSPTPPRKSLFNVPNIRDLCMYSLNLKCTFVCKVIYMLKR